MHKPQESQWELLHITCTKEMAHPLTRCGHFSKNPGSRNYFVQTVTCRCPFRCFTTDSPKAQHSNNYLWEVKKKKAKDEQGVSILCNQCFDSPCKDREHITRTGTIKLSQWNCDKYHTESSPTLLMMDEFPVNLGHVISTEIKIPSADI